jgi:hypothetical protein
MVTRDLEEAMRALSERFGAQWGAPATVDGQYRTSSGLQQWTIQVVHSAGPIAIELIEGALGSLWACGEVTRLHHYAFWSTDLDAEIVELQAKNYEIELASIAADGGPGGFAYLVRPGSARLELIRRADTRRV